MSNQGSLRNFLKELEPVVKKLEEWAQRMEILIEQTKLEANGRRGKTEKSASITNNLPDIFDEATKARAIIEQIDGICKKHLTTPPVK